MTSFLRRDSGPLKQRNNDRDALINGPCLALLLVADASFQCANTLTAPSIHSRLFAAVVLIMLPRKERGIRRLLDFF